MHFAIIALVFGVIFIAELPDKSLFASLVLGSRYPGFYVWLGAASAFFIHVIIAVTAGRLLTLLPHKLLEAIIAALFLGGALLLFFGKHGLEDTASHKHTSTTPDTHSFWKVFGTSFSVVFLGEWGDITQITTANYAARYHDTVNVAIGAILGLWAVTALAIVAGSKALTLVPQKVLLRITGSVLLLFAVFSALSALK
ncbi:MAG TPA: TMEM165/GDT1 family protein [Verrucomicrobiae bacterium]|jgi:putative Ca2+/H+ antiporter (TMEM165/GDT1 family)|nr:TMEM165/GDT1 family protein [Verrucomicrobiae bacterium]